MKRALVAATFMLALTGCVTDDGYYGDSGYYDGPYYGGGYYDRSPVYYSGGQRHGYSCDLPGRGRVVTEDRGDCRRLQQRVDRGRDRDRDRDRDRWEKERRERERHADREKWERERREKERRDGDRRERDRRERDRDRWENQRERGPVFRDDTGRLRTRNPGQSE